MEEVAEGLWGLSEYEEKRGNIGGAIKCLEALCQSQASFLPIVDVKTRLRIATLLLSHTHNVNHAKSHLERAQLLLLSIPSCFDLKCRTYSLLSQCYHLLGAIPSQKQIIQKALQLISNAPHDYSLDLIYLLTDSLFMQSASASLVLWSCNFNSQLANALIIQGDYHSAISALQSGCLAASQISYPELQMFFLTSILHVHLMQCDDPSTIEQAVHKCNEVWDAIPSDRRERCVGLVFYKDLLHIFYRLRICDYKNAAQQVDKLDAAVKADSQKTEVVLQVKHDLSVLNESLYQPNLASRERSLLYAKQAQLQEQLFNLNASNSTGGESLEPPYFSKTKWAWEDKLSLAPAPINGQWLPKSAVFALVDLMAVIVARPKGNFKDCETRILSGMHVIQDELAKLGIHEGVKEVELQHAAIWMAGVYLMLMMHFLENKVAAELTRSEFVEAQQALVQMRNLFTCFPTILQACEGVIEMLRGQYAHSVGCYSEAVFHYIEAGKLTENKSMQVTCQAYAAVSYFCIGDAGSSAQALDLVGPLYGMNDSSIGVREEASILFAYGLVLMKQQSLQEARNKLAKGLQIAHAQMGNLQLVSQYLTILGNLALALHDTNQAREILRSALTLAKKLSDIPTQIWVLSVLTVLFNQLEERGNAIENEEYQGKKLADLQQRLADAHSSIHHIELVDKVKLQVEAFHEVGIKHAMGGQPTTVDLDIPESVGLSSRTPARSSSRLADLDTRRRGKRKI